jgi:hypothetical protein
MKLCNICREIKETTHFSPNRRGYAYACKTCLNLKARELAREKNPAKGERNPNPVIEGAKKCPRCTERKDISFFTASLDYCKRCQAARVKELYWKKRNSTTTPSHLPFYIDALARK